MTKAEKVLPHLGPASGRATRMPQLSCDRPSDCIIFRLTPHSADDSMSAIG